MIDADGNIELEDPDDDFILENENEENCTKFGKRKANLNIKHSCY